MLGLGSSVASSSSPVGPFVLPVSGSYIFLKTGFETNNSAITGDDGVAPNRECKVISPTEIEFDDTEWEEYSFPITSQEIYDDQEDYMDGDNMSPTLDAGDSVTISGRITQADTTSTFAASSANANLLFQLNAQASDTTIVYVDEDNTATISGNKVEVNSSGDFTRTFTLAGKPVRFRIQSGDVGLKAASGDPGVRISNLRLVKN